MGEPETQAGRILAGRFRLERQLGEGGFGTIWRAEQLVLGAPVAVKLIDMSIARQAGALERFLREAQAAATLRSPHVVQILDYGVEGDQPFIAMELLEGENLAERLHRVGRLAPSEAMRIVTHIARAISRAHECNIVHRDLKPENVFLVRNEDDEVAKVLDFGVAKIKSPIIIDESTQTRTGSLIGTPHYMSPEQVQGNKTVDYRSDIWALGIIAFEMFTGQRPFTGNALGDLVLQICVRDIVKPSQLAPVPAGFDEWFARASERDQENRFQSARELAQTLRDVVGSNDRGTSLVISDDLMIAPDSNQVGVSAIVASESDAAVGKLAPESLELAKTVFNPHGPLPDGKRTGTPSMAWVLTALLLGSVVALGLWYRGSKRVNPFRTSFVVASASMVPTAIVASNLSVPSAAESARIAVPSTRPARATRERSSANASRLRESGTARNAASYAGRLLDAAVPLPIPSTSLVEPATPLPSVPSSKSAEPAASPSSNENKP